MPSSKTRSQRSPASSRSRSATASDLSADASTDASGGLAEQLLDKIIKPLGLVVLTRDRIQEVLDDAAERGRVTRSDANELATELFNRGRQQTDQLLSDIERLFGRGRQQLGSTMRARRGESLDLLLRNADRARRSVGAGQTFPILGFDDLTAAQVQARLDGLAPAELRRVRDYERRHANRKSVLAAIDKHLTSD